MKTRKKLTRLIAPALLLAIAGLLLALPKLAGKKNESAVTLLSCTAEKGSVNVTLAGGGVLREQDAVEITAPSGVEITRFLVKNGDEVTEGTPLCEVDRVSVMSSVTQVQEALDTLGEQIEEAASGSGTLRISAPAQGRVKAVYAQPGDDVRTVMLRSGALALVSLDGLMAFRFESTAALRVGDRVSVFTQDGTEYAGRVESALGGRISVTISDDGPRVDEEAAAYDADGALLGTGPLVIHSPWRVMATEGKVAGVSVRENREVGEGERLFTLSEVKSGAEQLQLSQRRREYEALLRELFLLYQDGVVKADRDGIVTGVEEDAVTASVPSAGGFIPLANAPGPDPDASYRNRVGMVVGIKEDGTLQIRLQPIDITIPDYTKLVGVVPLPQTMVTEGECAPAPVFELTAQGWVQRESIAVGDVFVFCYDGERLVWMIYAGHNEVSADTPAPQLPEGFDPSAFDPSTIDPSAIAGLIPGGGGQQTPSLEDIIAQYGGSYAFPGFDFSAMQPQEDDGLYSLKGKRLMDLTPDSVMELVISVDELDVLRYEPGMEATVTVDALPGRSFEARVSHIAARGVGSGGTGKFQVVLTMDRAPGMLGGMSASVVLRGEDRSCLCIPVAALCDSGSESFVYTAVDPRSGKLTSPVAVTTGASDGITVEITAGLSEGDTVWYSYYDALPEDAG